MAEGLSQDRAAAILHEMNTEATCALCGQPIGTEPSDTASDGALVHERCGSEYEDIVYFREFEGDDDDT